MSYRQDAHYLIFCLAVILASCQAAASQPATLTAPAESSLVEQAAQEATRIVQQAQATALVLKAQAQASALVSQAGAVTPAPSVQNSGSQLEPTQPASPGVKPPAPTKPAAVTIPVEVLSVGFAADGGMLIVRFMAPEKEAAKWWQGSVQVIQESSQQEYGEIPVMPVIGPLISRPKQDGQAGYVMLYHNPALIKTGDLVTVILGSYKFEHVEVIE